MGTVSLEFHFFFTCLFERMNCLVMSEEGYEMYQLWRLAHHNAC